MKLFNLILIMLYIKTEKKAYYLLFRVAMGKNFSQLDENKVISK